MANCLFIITVPKVLDSDLQDDAGVQLEDEHPKTQQKKQQQQEELQEMLQVPHFHKKQLSAASSSSQHSVTISTASPAAALNAAYAVSFGDKAEAEAMEVDDMDDVQRLKSLSLKKKRRMTPAEIVYSELDFLSVDYSRQVLQSGQFIQIQFMYQSSRAEALLVRFVRLGIGKQKNTNINLFNPSVCQVGDTEPTSDQEIFGDIVEADDRLQTFLQSMKSRLMVSQVYSSVLDKGRWTFDFVCFLICAASIASVGLATNSSVMVVASMLLSPLMGPILALTFSWRLRRRRDMVQGLVNTLLAILIIFCTGFVLQLLLLYPLMAMGYTHFPSREMTEKGWYPSLVFGCLVSFACSYGVCVSVLQGDKLPNVGVAISAATLPPVANSGMLVAYALLLAASPPLLLQEPSPEDAAIVAAVGSSKAQMNCTFQHFEQFLYKPSYSCSMVAEMLSLSSLSLLRCLVNVAIVIGGSYVWLTLKEVAPDALTRSEAIRDFYKHDLKAARGSKCLHGDTRQQLLREFESTRPVAARDPQRLRQEFETVEDIIRRENYRTICGMQHFGSSLSLDQQPQQQQQQRQQQQACNTVTARYLSELAQDTNRQTPTSPEAKRMGRFSVKEREIGSPTSCA